MTGSCNHWCVTIALFVSAVCYSHAQDCAATQGGNGGGADCAFPFVYLGTSYDACITTNNGNKPWCSVTATYNGQWGNCVTDCTAPACPIATTSGNGGDAECVFPFVYNSATYYNCITSGGVSANPWCATTGNWDEDGQWGECVVKSSRNDAPCVFPFTYKGTTYSSCTSEDCYGPCDKGPWCGLKADVTDNINDYGYCSGLKGDCSLITTTTTTAAPTTTCDGGDGLQLLTNSGPQGGQPCVFPFKYRNKPVTACITQLHNQLWCATTDNYDKDHKWGNCDGACISTTTVITTTTAAPETCSGPQGGDTCVFPFYYYGRTINTCISEANGNKPWCATTDNYNRDRQWANCDGPCDTTASTTEATTPTTTATTTVTTPATTTTAATTTDCPAGDCSTTVTTTEATTTVTTTLSTTEATTTATTTVTEATSTTGIPTTPDPCPDSWEEFATTLAYEGTELTGVATIDECKAVCLSVDECLAIDFSSADNSCYWHGDAAYLDKLNTNALTVTQFRRIINDCSTTTEATTTVETTTLTTPTQATTLVTLDGCVDTFDVNPGINAASGTGVAAATTLELCQAACLATPECLAIDWNELSAGTKCYWHGEGYLDRLGVLGTNTQYRRVECGTTTVTTATPGCEDTFVIQTETYSLGGASIDTAFTVEACQAACVADTSCIAFDFNNNNNRCYTHTELLEELTSADIDQYRRGTCSTTTVLSTLGVSTVSFGCEDIFENVENTLSLGGEELAGIQTVISCENICRSVPTCIGFDFNKETNHCFWHSNAGYEGIAQSATCCDQYRRGTECTTPPSTTMELTTPTSTTAAPTTTTTEATTTTTEPTTTTGSTVTMNTDMILTTTVPACPIIYIKFEQTLSAGGDQIAGIATQPDCEALCTASGACKAYDFFTTNVACFIHNGDDFLNHLINGGNVVTGTDVFDQYRKGCEGDSTIATTTVATTTAATTPTTAVTTPTTIVTTVASTVIPTLPSTMAPTNAPTVAPTTLISAAPTTPTTTVPAVTTTVATTTASAGDIMSLTCSTEKGNFVGTADKVSALSAANPTQGFIRTDITSSLGKTAADCADMCCRLVGCVALDWRFMSNDNICYLLNGLYATDATLQDEAGSIHYKLV